jgi:predicted metal-dependent phosphoesterase TrpH
MSGHGLRLIAGLVCLAGLTLGSLADEGAIRKPLRSGEFWILAGDFHVHAFPGDGSLTPPALRDEAVRAGLDVIAITNHNQTLTGRLAQWLADKTDGPMVIAGEEVTHAKYHLIALGISRTVPADRPAAEAIAAIQSQGGVAIAAHPGPSFPGFDDSAFRIVDGVEVGHPADKQSERQEFADAFRRARGLHPQVAPIGSSDVHVTPMLGKSRTFVFARERTIASVLDAIREGRTVAADETGHLYGDPGLIAQIQNAAPQGRLDTHRNWRRISMCLAWAGLAGLLVFGGVAW